ncbi:hypothetical protein GH714_000594 [Hevea brasiliensis]|uniref:Bidirectional sugar transporter SWEET n=1 Tax=Hevea brasiliensis TaxID=3981 RepID=A0A6A6L845_HEVBR|nr:hypothetical protein GH714_000594 [Hevea brasiliensis]
MDVLHFLFVFLDYIQENHKKQVHRTVFRHPIRDDNAQLSPFRLEGEGQNPRPPYAGAQYFCHCGLCVPVCPARQHRKLFCGLAATIFSIIMYGSPLSIMRLVIKTKSVEFMPFFLSLFVFLCGTSWFIYGLLGHDPFIAVPNGFGCGLGAIQLILYFIYRNNKGAEPAKKPTSQSVEMGSGKPQQEKQMVANGSLDEQV